MKHEISTMRLESLLDDDLTSLDLTSIDLTSVQDDDDKEDDNDEVLRIRLAGIIAARQRKYNYYKHAAAVSKLLPSSGHSGMRPRVDKLQTLEAKMAGIEVSLGWKRRREALLETLPRPARDLVRELDTLHAALRDKDQLIQSLRTHINNLGCKVGCVGGGGAVLSEAERRSISDRLETVTTDMDARKVAIKNLRLTLENIDITDNIDVHIRAAEMEYELEREELNILNLKEECNVLTARLHESSNSGSNSPVNSNSGETNFHNLLSSGNEGAALAGAFLVAVTVNHTPGNPPFHVTPQPPLGCVIDWATDDTRLRKGDRLIEVNGSSVIGRGLEVVTRFIATAKHLDLVVARPVPGYNNTTARRADGRLEKQLEDRTREMKECITILDKALKNKETLKSDNTRLNHRISYLEDHVLDLQSAVSSSSNHTNSKNSMRDSVVTSQPGTTVIQVFQKGDQTLAVASPEVNNHRDHAQQYPTLSRVQSPDSTYSSSSSSSFDKPTHHPQQSATSSHTTNLRLPRPSNVNEHGQGHKRMLSPRPESRTDDSRPSSRSRPVPPKKPERLSLHRTTSMQSIEEGIHSISRASSSTHTQGNILQAPLTTDKEFGKPKDKPEYSYYHENCDGGVTMVLKEAPMSHRLDPQGEDSPPARESRTMIRNNTSPIRRSQSTDSALHLDGDQSYNSSQEIYINTGYLSSQNHSYHDSHRFNLNMQYKHAISADINAPLSSASLSVATLSSRPQEQWC